MSIYSMSAEATGEKTGSNVQIIDSGPTFLCSRRTLIKEGCLLVGFTLPAINIYELFQFGRCVPCQGVVKVNGGSRISFVQQGLRYNVDFQHFRVTILHLFLQHPVVLIKQFKMGAFDVRRMATKGLCCSASFLFCSLLLFLSHFLPNLSPGQLALKLSNIAQKRHASCHQVRLIWTARRIRRHIAHWAAEFAGSSTGVKYLPSSFREFDLRGLFARKRL